MTQPAYVPGSLKPPILLGLRWLPLGSLRKEYSQSLHQMGLQQPYKAAGKPRTDLNLNPLPRPAPTVGQTSASRPPSFDQYRAGSQGGCRLHPPWRPQLSQGHSGEGLTPNSGAGGRVGGIEKASLTHSHSQSTNSEHQLCTQLYHQH